MTTNNKPTSISDWDDLQPFGINCLTGERDGFGLRLLCDLNWDGVRLIKKFFGFMPVSNTPYLESNWNSKVNGQDAVRSIMLPRSILTDLAAFALLQENEIVWIHSNGFCESPSEDSKEMYNQVWEKAGAFTDHYDASLVPEYFKGIRRIKGIGESSANGICTHQMSGRA